MQYGYVRISTPQQNIERQIRNIKAQYPDALIVQEVYTGTKLEGRREMEKLLRTVKMEIPLYSIVFPVCPETQKKVLPYMRNYITQV